MVAPTGEQYEISGGGYTAVVTEGGATLRSLTFGAAGGEARPLLDGFDERSMPFGGRGQVLAPWANRIRDGEYVFAGRHLRLPLSEPARHNASHGLVRWCGWTLEERTDNSVSLVYRLMAQTGYPWTLDLHALYDVGADGLTVTLTATNLAVEPAPYVAGAHPYLTLGVPIDGLELTLPAATQLLTDDRKLPTHRQSVADTELDHRIIRPIRDTVFDHAFTDLDRDGSGRATTVLRDPVRGAGVALWVDERHRWLQVYSGEEDPSTARRALAVEPMTGPPDAFRSGDDLVVLAPAGADGDEHSTSWGIRALD